MIIRNLQQKITEKLFSGKIIIITGARQTGKSTLMKEIKKQQNKKTLFLDCDDPQTRTILQNQSTPNLLRLVGKIIKLFL